MGSIQTDALREAGNAFARYGKDIADANHQQTSDLAMPGGAFPAFALMAVDDYARIVNTVYGVTKALGEILGTVGLALGRVATHYDEMEQAHSDSFTYQDG